MTLPNFLIIGAAKAGTTSLYHYLRQHPAIYMSPVKETNYYWYEGQKAKRLSVKTRAAYEALFDGVTTETAIGEASPQYLNSSTAPDRIRQDLQGVRLIVSLRHPVDRAYSGYLGWLRNGRGSMAVRQALRPGREFFEDSLYHPRLSRYFDRFPRSHIKVILFDDFIARPAAVVQELFEFLDVDPTFAPDTGSIHNRTVAPVYPRLNMLLFRISTIRSRLSRWVPALARGTGALAGLRRVTHIEAPPLPDDLRADLQRQFAGDIRRTGDLIGRDLSRWLREPAGRPEREA
jgi:hypothetical protein